MSAITDYIDGGSWINHFDESERVHLLGFFYNLFKWLDRDKADALRLISNEFIWSREGNIVGRFLITVPEPIPSFQEMLNRILECDDVIKKHLYPDSADKLSFTFKA